MKNLPAKVVTPLHDITTLSESQKRLQRRAGSLVGIPQLPKTRAEREDLLAVLKRATKPAGAERVATVMMRLQAHYWRPDFSPAQAKAYYVDLIEDLAHIPADILDDAVGCYRRDHKEEFYPRSGAILELARPMIEERQHAIVRLERSLNEPSPQRVEKHTPESIARVKAAARSFSRRAPSAADGKDDGFE